MFATSFMILAFGFVIFLIQIIKEKAKQKSLVNPLILHSQASIINSKVHNDLILRPFILVSIALLGHVMFLPHMSILFTSFLPKTDHGYTFFFGIIKLFSNLILTIILPIIFFCKKPHSFKSVLELF